MADKWKEGSQEAGGNFRGDQFIILIVVISWVYIYVQFIVCHLYLHKAVDFKMVCRS